MSSFRRKSLRITLGVVSAAAGASLISRTDVLIIGSGGAGLTAALRAKSLRLNPLVIEKSPKIGGTTCYSGSGLWIPNTHLHADPRDSTEKALTYLETIVGDAGPVSSRERKLAFLEKGPQMVRWLEEAGYKWAVTPGYPDYFPHQPGSQVGGRTIEAAMWDANLLGSWKDKLNINPVRAPLPLYTYELSKIVRAKCSWDGMMTAFKVWGVRLYPNRFLGSDPVCLGVSMIGQLIYLNVQQGTPIWTETALKELTTDEQGRVTGAIIERQGQQQQQQITVEASKGVILAAGGFARNDAMRKAYQAPPITADWTSACPTDQGDAITAATAKPVGAATALMDSAWWGASMWDPTTKQGMWCLYDRGLPHSVIVDQEGRRYVNESQNYNALGTAIWNRHRENPAIPSYLVLDSNHRDRYVFAGRYMPGKEIPQQDIDSGFVTKADTLPELASKLGIPAEGLKATVERFNGFVDKGVDEDFRRGESPYDAFLGDPAYGKNRNLGKIEKGPFYAVKVWPGDLGTKGGILTDEHARAVRESGEGQYEVIKGLYAVGNSSASVMGRTYAGAGSTLGPGLTFAYIAAEDCAKQ
ncbi:3-ketosteroid dehydrogenase [Sodiomyces alkalinus F11]|uniref:3-ketosteroid dehydrogenase n=1 Tax=Sodiomyces alkalinus (strain CBS 110278 / VKM F-3762 / F11) TaxID=1314773 RepID=A0A3N2Q7W8_SODAK|nr:3-ketosteroid dehydrogenase [Sodiomyces alkalinus F11]ROT42871.1 3-ketosteroid dehydrogenase [Sodiomyces alkalinus F11]